MGLAKSAACQRTRGPRQKGHLRAYLTQLRPGDLELGASSPALRSPLFTSSFLPAAVRDSISQWRNEGYDSCPCKQLPHFINQRLERARGGDGGKGRGSSKGDGEGRKIRREASSGYVQCCGGKAAFWKHSLLNPLRSEDLAPRSEGI